MEKLNQKNMRLETYKGEIITETNHMVSGPYGAHYHDHFELEIVIEGSGSQIFNNQEFSLNTGDMYVLRPLDVHQILSNDITIRNVKIKENAMQQWILKRLYTFKNPVVYHLDKEQFELFINLFDLVSNELAGKASYALETTSLLCELIYTYFFRLDKEENNNADMSFINRVIYFLQHDNRFTQKVTLQEIADYVGYSKFYTSTIFHKIYGMTIQQFIINLRIEYAKKLINKTDYSITEIALECGFSSSSNFYSHFTKLVGASPLQYKKQMNNKENI